MRLRSRECTASHRNGRSGIGRQSIRAKAGIDVLLPFRMAILNGASGQVSGLCP